MNGSRTELSQSQIRHAESHCCLVRNDTGLWSLADPYIADEPSAATVAAMRAEHLIRLLCRRPTDGVLIIGGDTAYAFLAALGSPPIVPITQRLVDFYAHESCGKCTPCREGLNWLSKIYARIVQGGGRESDQGQPSRGNDADSSEERVAQADEGRSRTKGDPSSGINAA